ncbi:MAG: gliding motility-associated-like protein [Arcticibacterium sp.]|jgi:gliding motility-associated-like protein
MWWAMRPVLASINMAPNIVQKIGAFCPSADTVLIEDGCIKLYFPSAFSPNGDGENDVFMLFGKDQFEFDLEIKDKRGTVMYIVIDKPFNGKSIFLWDGNYRGQAAPVAVYSFYLRARLKVEGQLISQTRDGIINLLR